MFDKYPLYHKNYNLRIIILSDKKLEIDFISSLTMNSADLYKLNLIWSVRKDESEIEREKKLFIYI